MKILIQIIKITTLALFFTIAIHFSYGALFDDKLNTKPSELSEVQNFANTGNNNKYKFRKSDTQILANVGVALSTNVGIKYKQRGSNNLYKDLPGIAQTVSYKSFADNSSLSAHMSHIHEYYNVMKTDVKLLLDNSYNKRETLEAYIDQLEFRYKKSIGSMKTLLAKKNELSISMNASAQKIDNLKTKIDSDFKKFDSKQTNTNIEDLLKAKAEYNYARTHIIFINQYLKQYQFLNNYNKKVLDALINNKDAITKNAYVVIPDTGIDILKKMDLVISEEEHKSTK